MPAAPASRSAAAHATAVARPSAHGSPRRGQPVTDAVGDPDPGHLVVQERRVPRRCERQDAREDRGLERASRGPLERGPQGDERRGVEQRLGQQEPRARVHLALQEADLPLEVLGQR